MLGLLAAIGNTGSGCRQFDLRAIDEPRAGGVHALKTGEIEDHAFRVFSRGEERSPGRLQLVSRADDPFPRQREHDPVLAVLTSYGRRCGHQALRPSRNGAHIAPPRGCRANTMPSPARKGSGEKQTKYELDDSATRTQNSRIRRVESFASARGDCKDHHQIVGLLCAPHASNGDWRTIRRTNGEGIGDCPNRRAPPFKGKPQSPLPSGIRQTSSPNRRPAWACPMPQTETGGTIRRTNGEGIGDCPNRRAPPFKGKPQSPLSRGPIKSWLTRGHRPPSSSGLPACRV